MSSFDKRGVGGSEGRWQEAAIVPQASDGFPQAFETVGRPVLPDDEAEWQHMAALIDYDPRPALGRIEVPMLALFGAEDRITPVDESVAVFQETVRPGLLQVEVFAGADHRLQAGDPPALVEGYLATLADFVLDAIVPKPVSR